MPCKLMNSYLTLKMTFSFSRGYIFSSYINFPLNLCNLLLGGSQLISTNKGKKMELTNK